MNNYCFDYERVKRNLPIKGISEKDMGDVFSCECRTQPGESGYATDFYNIIEPVCKIVIEAKVLGEGNFEITKVKKVEKLK